MESELICGSLTVDFNAALPALTHQVSLPDGTRAATLRYVQTAWNHWTWELAADTCARRGQRAFAARRAGPRPRGLP
jgi:hypothetical protein